MAYNIPEVLRNILTGAPHSAFTLIVDNKIDPYPVTEYPDGTWAKPYRSIQDAVDVANALPFTDLDSYSVAIRVQEGLYDEDVHVTRWGFFSLVADGPVTLGLPPVFGPGTIRSIYWDVNAPDPGPGFVFLFIGGPSYMDGFVSSFGAGFSISGNVVPCGFSGIGSVENRAFALNTSVVWGDSARVTATGRYGIVGNDGTPGLAPPAYPVLTDPIAVAIQNCGVGYDSGVPGVGEASVEILLDRCVFSAKDTNVYGDVNLSGGPIGCVVIGTRLQVNGDLDIPNSLQYSRLLDCKVGDFPFVHAINLKSYGSIRGTGISGIFTISGTAAEVGDGYVFDSRISGTVVAPNPNSFRIDRTTEYFIDTHGTAVTPGATIVVETGGGGGSVGAFTDLSDVPVSYVGAGGEIVRVNLAATGLEFVPVGSVGAQDFVDLNDVPSSYAGASKKVVRVNSVGDGLEFVPPGSVGGVYTSGDGMELVGYAFSVNPQREELVAGVPVPGGLVYDLAEPLIGVLLAVNPYCTIYINGILQIKGIDYTESNGGPGGVGRITFILSSVGSGLTDGDKITVLYWIAGI